MITLICLIVFAIILSALLARARLNSAATTAGKDPGDPPRRILIIGATGGTGRELVKHALKNGYTVTVLVRDPGKLGLIDPQLVIMKGDVLDYPSVEAATRDQEAVVSALGHKRFYYPTRILSRGTQNIVRAMEATGVSRLICATSLGIGNSAGRMGLYYTLIVIPFVLGFYFWDKTRQERIIAGSALEWVIVRPGLLTNSPERGNYRHGLHLGSYLWTVRISRADVAAFMLSQLSDNTYLHRAVGVSW